ncbi:YHYH protein [Hoeflea prorocentri]|uniref:YHYH protein n=1 Tax=Hoeflea prorocentri TaxID=1922333 RepID=A0A9X3UP08_9HYPH|nr:YHYH protein [Hoeflea prorocentri]MCY6382566.1 YHYH protein [Hoeflea prorocentri]MDA5400366.1 YHYH protein [Hoeflea prorocentri]
MTSRAVVGFGFLAGLLLAAPGFAHDADETEQAADSNPASVDITDVILTNTSPDCADHVSTSVSEITDLQQERPLGGAVIITADEDGCTIRSNGIPNHNVGGGSRRNFPSPVAAIDHTFKIARNPQASEQINEIDHGSFDAVMLNGAVVDIQSAGCYRPTSPQANPQGNVLAGCRADDPWLLDPMSPLAGFAEDNHHAHTQPDGRYHYHGNPRALFDDDPGPDGSPLIGFAADGFPIYGSYFKDETGTVRKVKSGYTLKEGMRPSGDGNPGGAYDGLYRDDYEFTNAGDLDECNGMTVGGSYRYYVTDAYPWIVACLRGQPDRSFFKPR